MESHRIKSRTIFILLSIVSIVILKKYKKAILDEDTNAADNANKQSLINS